jgi:hypothetical protein
MAILKMFVRNKMITTDAIYVICMVVALALFLIFFVTRRKERYGGPVKKVRKIPFNDCKMICESYYNKCVRDFANADPGFCEERFRQACVSECYYSNYQRM